MCSWYISSLLAIFHIDVWMSDYCTDGNGYMLLMNVMCDMSQFVVLAPIPGEYSATLAFYFVKYVLIKFGMYCLIV